MQRTIVATLVMTALLAIRNDVFAGDLAVTGNLNVSSNLTAQSVTLGGESRTNWPSGGGGSSVQVLTNGVTVGTVSNLNLIAGSNVSLTVTQAGSQVDVIIAAAASGGAGARIYSSTNLTIGTSFQTLTFNSVRFDDAGFYSTNYPTRLTVPAGYAGKYIIGVQTDWGGGGNSGTREADILLNGTTTIAANSHGATAQTQRILTQTVYVLQAGDYVEANVWQGSGVNRTIYAYGDFSPVLYLYRIGN